MAAMKSGWEIAGSSARRAAAVLNGGWRWLSRSMAGCGPRVYVLDGDGPVLRHQLLQLGRRLLEPVDLPVLQRRRGGGGVRDDLPLSIRSKWACLPPAVKLTGSVRGT